MRVFQTTYKDIHGQTQKTARWYIELADHLGTRRRIPGLTDRRATEAIGRNIEKLVRFKVSGEPLDPVLTKWVESLIPKLRTNLAKIGLLNATKVAALRPLVEHIDGAPDTPGWRQHLTAKGGTGEHVKKSCARVRRILDGCRFAFWSDISASRTSAFLHELRADKADAKGKVTRRGISAATFNHHLVAFKSFCKWMVKDGRASESPVAHLDGLNVKTDRRHERRALTVDELRWLLDITRNGPKRYGMTGVERVMLYRIAAETGFRANELRSLTRASFKLDGDKPSVTVQAGYSKRRREDMLPLRADTAADLHDFLSVKLPGVAMFNMPRADEVADMFKADLADAREAWLADATLPQEREKRQASSFLCYCDAAGLYADFHALRHTTGSLLAASGAHPKVAQSLMRHSDINLTMSLYTHTLAGQEADAVATLPRLDISPIKQQAKAKATGTDNVQAVTGDSVLGRGLGWKGGKSRIPANAGEQNHARAENAKHPENIEENQCLQGVSDTASEGNRTLNIRFTKAVLYH